MKAAVDTNVLVYAEGLNDIERRRKAVQVLDVPSDRLIIPVQVLGELYNVLTRKGVSREQAHASVHGWSGRCNLAGTSLLIFESGLDLAMMHRLSIWDAVVLSAAVEAECDLLLTEDLQDGFRWRGVTVVNPFAEKVSPLLDAFLAQP